MDDLILLGVLRMPITYKSDQITLHQFVACAREAADRIEADSLEIERLRAEIEIAKTKTEGGVVLSEPHLSRREGLR